MDVPDRRAVSGPVRRASWLLLKSHIRDATCSRPKNARRSRTRSTTSATTRDVRSNVPVRATALLRDPQIMLFCFLYFDPADDLRGDVLAADDHPQDGRPLTDFQVGLLPTRFRG